MTKGKREKAYDALRSEFDAFKREAIARPFRGAKHVTSDVGARELRSEGKARERRESAFRLSACNRVFMSVDITQITDNRAYVTSHVCISRRAKNR